MQLIEDFFTLKGSQMFQISIILHSIDKIKSDIGDQR